MDLQTPPNSQHGPGRRRSRRRKQTELIELGTAVNIAGFVLVSSTIAALLTFTVSFGQALLAASLPAGCIWAMYELPLKAEDEGSYPGAAWAVRALAAVSVAVATWGDDEGPCLLAVCTLACVGANSTRIPLGLPFGSFVPYSALIALCVAVVYGGDEGRFGVGWVDKGEGGALSVVVALVGAILFSAVIVAWSVFWVHGEHGPIQVSMGPTMSPMRILIYSIINGIGEELEFRMLLLGGLIARPATHETAWLCLALGLQAAYFASLHFSRGFPSGYSGVLILFVWAYFLGALRLWTGSFVLPILSHIQLDIVVFALIYIEEQRRTQEKLTRGAAAARGAGAGAAASNPPTIAHSRGSSKVD